MPKLTMAAINELRCAVKAPYKDDAIHALHGLQIQHDGRVACFCDPGKKVGIAGASFDDSFFDEGVRTILAKGSSGQLAADALLRRLSREPVFVDELGTKVNDLWLDWRRQVLEVQQANAEEGPWTVLLDEPERSIDVPRRARLWATIQSLVATRQVLVATHDPFALFLTQGPMADARVFETVPGYVAACWRTMGAMAALAGGVSPGLDDASASGTSVAASWLAVVASARGTSGPSTSGA